MSKFFVIEKDVPLDNTMWGAAQQAPFETMEVGDSFLIPEDSVGAIRNAASRFQKNTGKVFTIRRRKGENGHRCWRVK